MKTRKEKKTTNRSLNILILVSVLCLFFYNKIDAQCDGADIINASSNPMGALPAACNPAFSGTSWKYRLQSTYVPAVQDPVITVKLVVHVITTSATNPSTWNNGTGQYNGLAALQTRLSNIQGGEERYSQARLANYVTPSPYPQYIYDSKVQYEVVAYYFYPNSVLYYGTANGLPEAPLYINNLPNPYFNPRIYFVKDIMDYINQTYPDRLAEGLPVLIANDGQRQATYSSASAGAIPYMTVPHYVANSPASQTYNDRFIIGALKHEIGHCFGLLHAYFGSPCYPKNGASAPETYDTIAHRLDCNHLDYLSDLLPVNNPNAAANSYPYPSYCKQPPLNSCNSVYEGGDTALGNSVYTNNMMTDNAWNGVHNNAVYGWMSSLQMARRIRSMHFLSNAFSSPYVGNWSSIRQYAKEARSEHAYPLNITTNETWEFDVQMYKDILVKAGNTLTIKCRVAMATDGKIVVENGAKLIIDGGEVTGWCKKTPLFSFYNSPLWFGIELHGNWNQAQLINNTTGLCANQGIVEVKNGGTVSYSMYGIYTGYEYNYGQLHTSGGSGGIVIANDANFINNVFDILFFQYQVGVVRSKLVNCKFLTTGEIGKDGNGNIITPQAHVKLYLNNGIYFDNCTFQNTSTVYTGTSLGIGIASTDSQFNVGYNNIVGSTPATKCVFDKLSTGIWIDNANPLYAVNIKNSDFTHNNYCGIVAENCNYLLASENTFTTRQNEMDMYLYQCKYYKIKNNDLLCSSRPIKPGVSVYSSGNGAHEIYRNNFSEQLYAIICMDNNGGIGGAMGLKMNCNNFAAPYKNNWDISLTTSTNNVMPTIYQNQSGSGTALAMVRNVYGANDLGSTHKNKFFIDPSNTQFITHACNTDAVTNPNKPTVRSSPQLNVLQTSIPLNYSTDCLPYPLSAGGSGGAGDRLEAMNSYITQLKFYSGEDRDAFEIQSTVSAKLNLFLTDTLEGSQDSVINILAANQGAMDDADIQLVFAYLKKGDFANAIEKSNNLPDSRQTWKNLFTKIFTIEQDSMRAKSVANDVSMISFLTSYANTEAGDGQACAQAYLKFALGTTHEFPLVYPDDGATGARIMTPGTKEDNNLAIIDNPALKVYPNPAQAGITLFYESVSDGLLTIQIKDLLGKIIFTNFIKKQNKEYISLNGLSNGIYLLSVSEGNREIIYQAKLIKQD